MDLWGHGSTGRGIDNWLGIRYRGWVSRRVHGEWVGRTGLQVGGGQKDG
jgi:hypothetical protein